MYEMSWSDEMQSWNDDMAEWHARMVGDTPPGEVGSMAYVGWVEVRSRELEHLRRVAERQLMLAERSRDEYQRQSRSGR